MAHVSLDGASVLLGRLFLPGPPLRANHSRAGCAQRG